MRVAGDHLGLDAGDDLLEVEGAALLGQADEEGDLEEEVAELAGELAPVAGVDGGRRLVRLLEQVGAQVGGALLAVPGAAVGRAQPRDEVDQTAHATILSFLGGAKGGP